LLLRFLLSLGLLSGVVLPPVAAGPGLPARTPADAGMNEERLENLERLVLKGHQAGGYPGAALLVARDGYSVVRKGFGRLSWDSSASAVSPDSTLYDLASLTKIVGTTTAIMILHDERKLALDDHVAKFLPEFRSGDKALITIRQLLTHYSGLPAGRQLWLLARTPEDARKAVLDAKLFCKPGRCFNYSDLGPDVLGFIVEAISGTTLDRFLTDRVFVPLQMSSTMFKPPPALRSRVAPTETNPPRGYRLQGEVHDESAFALGGIAGHAGLFSTADDVSIFAQMMLGGGEYGGVRIVAESTVRIFTSRTTGTRALGWDTANGEAGAGQFLSPRAYGHAGYTGTSLWIDPERKIFAILLTNRVHAPRIRQPGYLMADVRNDLMDAVVLSLRDSSGALPALTRFRSDTVSDWNARLVRRGTRW
jgi:CubicO group peptidase (beta-lactamase class C family)